MSKGVKVRVWGERALFTRPEFKVERYSYDVITPSAARGLLEAIYWDPAIRWVIDKLYVKKPIKFDSIQRNEISSTGTASHMLQAINGKRGPLYINTKKDIVQSNTVLLVDVEYVIESHFEMTDKAQPGEHPAKYKAIMKRRLKQGACYYMPYFGCREYPANFELCNEDDIQTQYQGIVKELGYMLYDFDYSNPEDIKPMFFQAVLKDGVLDLTDCEVIS